jgi:membrane fusion protein, multidrug efflux system
MSAIEKPVLTPPLTAPAPVPATQPDHTTTAPARPKWQKYAAPALVLLLAAALVITIARNWNAWEGGRIEQVTDDAYVQGDLTPLSTKVAGIVKDVKVSDYQKVHKGDLLVQLEDDDYLAQVAQTTAAVEAANAAIQNNRPSKSFKMPASPGPSQALTRQTLRSGRRRMQERLCKPLSFAHKRNATGKRHFC